MRTCNALRGQSNGLPTSSPAMTVGADLPRDDDQKAERVLLVASNTADCETCRRALRALHIDSTWMRLGSDGLDAARGGSFGVVLIDLELSDMPSLEIARVLHRERCPTPVILMARPDTSSVTTASGDIGVRAILKKPLLTSHVISVVNWALAATADGDDKIWPHTTGSVARRWATLILRTIDATDDPKTLLSWSKYLGVSRSMLCESCALMHVSARAARDFARMLRAICRSGEKWEPETLLESADGRTLKKLLAAAGFRASVGRTLTVPEFLERQTYIPEGSPGMIAVRALLFGDRALPGVTPSSTVRI
jgi:CheY-like chemotaxis protein